MVQGGEVDFFPASHSMEPSFGHHPTDVLRGRAPVAAPAGYLGLVLDEIHRSTAGQESVIPTMFQRSMSLD